MLACSTRGPDPRRPRYRHRFLRRPKLPQRCCSLPLLRCLQLYQIALNGLHNALQQAQLSAFPALAAQASADPSALAAAAMQLLQGAHSQNLQPNQQQMSAGSDQSAATAVLASAAAAVAGAPRPAAQARQLPQASPASKHGVRVVSAPPPQQLQSSGVAFAAPHAALADERGAQYPALPANAAHMPPAPAGNDWASADGGLSSDGSMEHHRKRPRHGDGSMAVAGSGKVSPP